MQRNITYAIVGLTIAAAVEFFLGGFTIFMPDILKTLWGAPRTGRELFLSQYGIPLGSVLILFSVANLLIITGLVKLKKWAGYTGMAVCIIAGIFFLLPFQPLFDLLTSLVNFSAAMFIFASRQILGSQEV